MNREERALVARGARRELAKRSFRWFVEHCWDAVPQTRPLEPSLAIDAVCAALQAVAERRIMRLAICQPPGSAKSVLCAVLFPAWLFLRSDGAERVMVGSYTHKFTLRDAQRCRDLMQSDVFRALVDDRWRIRRYPDRQDDFWLTAGGRRTTVSPMGATGERCTMQIIDDPLSGAKIYSRATKDSARRWVAATLTQRLEQQKLNPRVLVMQRLVTDDPAAWAIAQGWRVLDLPAIFARDANFDPIEPVACELLDDAGELVWRDPRAPGETLSAAQDESALRMIRAATPVSEFAAQYLQRPQDESAAIFHRAYFKRRYADVPPDIERTVIALDASFKEADDSDFAVIQAWGALGEDRYLLEQWRRRAGYVDTKDELRAFIDRYPGARILVEAAANGHAIIDELGREFGEGTIESVPTTGGKRPRWNAISPICARGKVVLPEHMPELGAFIAEVCDAPNGENDDQLDAMAHALIALDDRATGWADYSEIMKNRTRR